MKKRFGIILSTFILTFMSLNTFGAEGIIKDGRTLVPVRGVFESLGFTVNWDSATNKASISDGTHEVSVIKGLSYFKADGKEIYPDVPQQIINGSFYLPLRAIGDAVGANTSWDNESKIAHISYNGKDVYVKCTTKQGQTNETTKKPQSVGDVLSSPIIAKTELSQLFPAYSKQVLYGDGSNFFSSVDGDFKKVYLSWAATNNSDKTIKYLNFDVVYYNSVGDYAYSDITNKPIEHIQLIGPINGGKSFWYKKYIGYCSTCSKIEIRNVSIEYMDGSVISGNYEYACECLQTPISGRAEFYITN